MRIYNKDLKQACRWLSARKTTKVIGFLEKKIPYFLDDPNYYAILGQAYLENGLVKDAQTYLDRGLLTDPNHLEIRLILAVNHLKKKNPAAAVRLWLEILEEYPGQKQASKGLKALKDISDLSEQEHFLTKLEPRCYLPGWGRPWLRRSILIAALFIIIASSYLAKDIFINLTQSLSMSSNSRAGAKKLYQPGQQLKGNKTDALYPMTEKDILRSLKKALKDFENYDDNSAGLEINKILNSNATKEIRDQAALMAQSLAEPDIDSLKTLFTYDQVSENPWLFDGCWVIWRGSTANIEFTEDSILFDFLVGFDKGQILEGEVQVVVPFLAMIENLPLELLARVETNGDNFQLIAKTLHFLR